MKLLTILQALALVVLAVIGATAGANDTRDCPPTDVSAACAVAADR